MSATLPTRQENTEHWLGVLRAHLQLVRAEIRTEQSSDHPGARHRLDQLTARAANIDGQILAAERCR